MKNKTFKERVQDRMTRCKFFTGIQHGTCEAGIVYRQIVGGPEEGWALKLPCFTRLGDTESKVDCPKRVFPTEIEATEEVQERDHHLEQFLSNLRNGVCPTCKVQVTQKQVGPCVYGSCGHRLYQGTVNPKFVAKE